MVIKQEIINGIEVTGTVTPFDDGYVAILTLQLPDDRLETFTNSGKTFEEAEEKLLDTWNEIVKSSPAQP
ncbi:hypothetical protein [Paenibacillus senegalensis]|uniref:hypothetical protein n=1 Tax=Paenibacillus senegalensis TaxID=1465766 RepID=UPI000287F580|nr:hypothetical protein [Paenibacillus senegalensis]